jgi:leader peptidase (prepilin peptidase)/N-methyltransferase
MDPYFILLLVLGLSFGSFINVIIYRYPRKISLIKPGSYCPSCNSPIPLYRNIPLFSFILQRGKCAQCNQSISFRYPLIESLIALFWGWGYIVFPNYENVLFIFVASILTIISLIDLDTMQIPLPFISMATISILFHEYFFAENFQFALHGFIAGVGYLSLVFLLTWIIFKKQTLGFGDLFLVAVTGLWLGAINVLVSIFIGAIIAMIVWLIISIKSGFDRNRPMPFGPYLAFSAIFVKMVHPTPIFTF